MIPASRIIKGEKSRRSRCLVETFGAHFPLPSERIRDEEAVWGELSQIAVWEQKERAEGRFLKKETSLCGLNSSVTQNLDYLLCLPEWLRGKGTSGFPKGDTSEKVQKFFFLKMLRRCSPLHAGLTFSSLFLDSQTRADHMQLSKTWQDVDSVFRCLQRWHVLFLCNNSRCFEPWTLQSQMKPKPSFSPWVFPNPSQSLSPVWWLHHTTTTFIRHSGPDIKYVQLQCWQVHLRSVLQLNTSNIRIQKGGSDQSFPDRQTPPGCQLCLSAHAHAGTAISTLQESGANSLRQLSTLLQPQCIPVRFPFQPTCR